ncbi:MAG: hypothetical protein B6I22_07075 [Desulfobacteraceae bacterium 4572_123]|nr:MAG: hypothetical protein B6I22_07075 [Desulfobacteraceae bacterium 4572_123]
MNTADFIFVIAKERAVFLRHKLRFLHTLTAVAELQRVNGGANADMPQSIYMHFPVMQNIENIGGI